MDAPQQQVNTPLWVWGLGLALGAARLGAYFALATPQDVAQGQLAYIPLWLLDLPWSFIYFYALPPPYGEAIVGPTWWALLPYLAVRIRRLFARAR